MAAVSNNIKECSVGLKLRDALCFSDKYVTKDSSLITLDDSDVSKTIRYRVNIFRCLKMCLTAFKKLYEFMKKKTLHSQVSF